MTPPLRRKFLPDGTEGSTNSLVTDLQSALGLPFQEGIKIEKTVDIGGTSYDIEHGMGRVARGYIVLDLTGTIGFPVRIASNELSLTFSKPALAQGSIILWVFLC